MANREYVPPPVYGPTPPSTEQLERDADELVKRIQDAMDKRQANETVPTVDPWELLRELLKASVSDQHYTAWFDAKEALKQHDEKKSGEWRCRCPSDPEFDTSVNPRCVARCNRCGAERPKDPNG